MQIEFKATKRDAQGTGASRRLRRAGRIPGILYGGAGETQPVSMDHNELYHLLRKEAFHASVLSIEVDGAKQNAVLSGAAVSRINESELDELVVTDTIPLRDDAKACPRIRQISVASLLADTILRISNEESVSSLFME